MLQKRKPVAGQLCIARTNVRPQLTHLPRVKRGEH